MVMTQGSRRRRLKHQWSSTEETRRAILDAARSVFGKYGFADANVAEIVELAGSSVGSLYHHFGGKSELFLALWEQYVETQNDLVAAAVAEANEGGVDDPWELFLVSSRAYLDDGWDRRDLVRIFNDGDTPTGFGKELADHRRTALAGGLKDAAAGGDALNRVIVLTFTSVIGEARREIARAKSAADAKALAENVVELLGRLRPLVAAS